MHWRKDLVGAPRTIKLKIFKKKNKKK